MTDAGFNEGMRTTASIEWATPPSLFHELDNEYFFSLDVCATGHNAKVDNFYTKDDDGLAQDWAPERCWMNPPYGRGIKDWMKKAYEESQKGTVVVCLVPARTDTRWWHDYAAKADEIRFLKGRVHFIRDDDFKAPAPFPSAVVIFDGRVESSEPQKIVWG